MATAHKGTTVVEDSLQHVVAQVTSPATYVGAASTVIWGLTADQWVAAGVIIGGVFTAATFAVNWYYKHKTWKDYHIHRRKSDR